MSCTTCDTVAACITNDNQFSNLCLRCCVKLKWKRKLTNNLSYILSITNVTMFPYQLGYLE